MRHEEMKQRISKDYAVAAINENATLIRLDIYRLTAFTAVYLETEPQLVEAAKNAKLEFDKLCDLIDACDPQPADIIEVKGALIDACDPQPADIIEVKGALM